MFSSGFGERLGLLVGMEKAMIGDKKDGVEERKEGTLYSEQRR